MSLNQCQFIGNLGCDPEIIKTKDGRSIAKFRIAVSQRWKDRNTDEQRERTEWINVVIYSEGLCKIAETYLNKGSQIFVQGQWQTRKWQDANGSDRYSTELVLQGYSSQLEMLDKRPSNNDEQAGKSQGRVPTQNDLDDVIPF